MSMRTQPPEKCSPWRRYASLTKAKAVADLKADAAKTYAGILWWIIDPILFMLVFYVIFAVLLERRTEDFVMFLLIGLVVFQWTQKTVISSANTILQARGLIRQIYLPKEIFPAVRILTELFKFALVFILLMTALWAYGIPPGPHYVWLLPLLLIQFILNVGMSLVLASVIPLLPDLQAVANHVMRMVFYLSGIFYSVEAIPERFHNMFFLNPMASLIHAYREVLLYQRVPDFSLLTGMALIAMLFAALGVFIIRRMDRRYPKLIFR